MKSEKRESHAFDPVRLRGIGRDPCVKQMVVRTLVFALATGCAPLPTRSSATGEREYAYQAPASIAEADRKECAGRADGEATVAAHSVSYEVEESVGPVLGIIGAVATLGSALTRTRLAAESAYENEMRTCLQEKGYELPK